MPRYAIAPAVLVLALFVALVALCFAPSPAAPVSSPHLRDLLQSLVADIG